MLPNSRGNPVSGALNTWGGKICDYRLKSPFISETVYEIGPWLLCYGTLIGSHRRPIDPCGSDDLE